MIHLNCTWNRKDNIALALSGGVDSMVLYHLLKTHYKDTYQKLYILHVNHGVREASDIEECKLKKLVNQNKDIFLMKKLDLEEFSQDKGRQLRYQFFNEILDEYAIDYCLTAHHKDDDLESIMFQILTNRYLKGLGIPEKHKRFLRPLLHTPLADILEYQQLHNITYYEDISNNTNDYTRNYIRHKLLPIINEHEQLNLYALESLKTDYNEMTEGLKTSAKMFLKKNSVKISRYNFNRETHIQRVFILAELLGEKVSRKYIEKIIEQLESNLSQFELPLGEKSLICSYNVFYLREQLGSDVSFHIKESGHYHFNGYTIEVQGFNDLIVRTFRPGDRVIIPNVGTKKVSRIFIDNKIPNDDRKLMPIVVNPKDEIIAVGTIYNIIKLLDKNNTIWKLEIKEHNFYDT